MSGILNDRKNCRQAGPVFLLLPILLLAMPPCRAQEAASARATALAARFVPEESLRYEFEGIVHLASGHVQGVTLNVPDDCSYRLRAVLKLDFDPAGADDALSGRVHFQAVQYDKPGCAIPPKSDLAKAAQDLEMNGTTFEINPAGDTRLGKPPASAKCEGVSVLLKAAWDLLQERLSDKPISPEPASVPSRHFLYWPDTFVENMEVAASSMQYGQDAIVAGHPYAWLQYKQVFSPEDMPAYVETRTRARDFTGTTFVTGKGSVSLLFDRASQRVVYLHRERSIDNRTLLKYEPSEISVPIARYSIEEESTVRWLPEKNSEAWLAELHKFESEPPEKVKAPSSSNAESGLSLADLAAASRLKPTAGASDRDEISDSLDRAPRGFERWQRSYCSSAYCFELSLAVPEQTRVVDRAQTTTLLLSGSGERTVTVAVGPVLDRQYQGLNSDELLQQQTARFIANELWFAGRSGQQLNSEISSVKDRPAAFSDFTATARDLTPIRGRLVMVIGPYDRLAPVTCSYAAAEQQALDAICQTVTGSVVIH